MKRAPSLRSALTSGFGLLLSLLLSTAHADVKAWLDANQVAAGDTVQLTLQHDGQTDDQPDLSPLTQDFDVLSTGRSSSVQIVNGSMTSHVELQLTLSPKRSGQLRIPPITWGNEQSNPLTLTVGGAPGGNTSGGQPASNSKANSKVFVETTVDSRQPYVQAAVQITVRLYTAVPLYQASLDLPANNDVLVQKVGADRNTTVIKDGQRYQMVERHYVLFPQHSGRLEVPGAVLDAQITVQDRNDAFANDPFKDFFGDSGFNQLVTRTKPIRVHGDDIDLNVRPRPAGVTSSYWLPARDVSITADWHLDATEVHVGDPVTVDLHLQANGLTAAQLPDLSSLLELPAGIKAYPDQAKLDNTARGDTVVGTRDQSIALIADRPGTFTLPAVQVQWWDTQSNAPRETTIPARTLTIMPAVGGASTTLPPSTLVAPPSSTTATSNAAPATASPSRFGVGGPWLWISIGFGVLWLATLFAWFWTHRRKASPTIEPKRETPAATEQVDAAAARTEFQRACRRSDARAARQNLLAWLNADATDAPIGLREFAKRADNPKLMMLLSELDRACYAGSTWNGTALLDALPELPTNGASKHDRDDELEPLYR